MPSGAPLGTGDFSAAKPSRNPDLNPHAPEAHGPLLRLAHRPSERNAPFQLKGDVFRDQLRVELGPLHFDDVDLKLFAGLLLQLLAEPVHFGPPLPMTMPGRAV